MRLPRLIRIPRPQCKCIFFIYTSLLFAKKSINEDRLTSDFIILTNFHIWVFVKTNWKEKDDHHSKSEKLRTYLPRKTRSVMVFFSRERKPSFTFFSFRCQFHQHFTCTFCTNILMPYKSWNKTIESCSICFRTKNLRVKCWWNWLYEVIKWRSWPQNIFSPFILDLTFDNYTCLELRKEMMLGNCRWNWISIFGTKASLQWVSSCSTFRARLFLGITRLLLWLKSTLLLKIIMHCTAIYMKT